MKRAADLTLALIGLCLTWPIILVLAVLIRRNSEGKGIFSQTRVGRNEETFRCHKLRTMSNTMIDMPTHDASAVQITSIGHLLRRTKLDELPQLWNVLIGEMSLVGPRPCLPSQVELIAERKRRGVFALRPGITGLAQIRGVDMSVPVTLAEIDAEYLRDQSFLYDLKVLFLTVFARAGQGDRVGPA